MEGEGCNVFGVPTVIDYGIGAGAGAGAYLWGRRTIGRSVYGHVFTKFSPMGSLPHFLTNDAPPRARDPLKNFIPLSVIIIITIFVFIIIIVVVIIIIII